MAGSLAPASRSWLDPRLEVRPSPIEGLGLFATAPIHVGEVVIVWGGRPITDAELRAIEVQWRATGIPYSSAAIDEGLSLLQDEDDPLRYGNHSCDPNLWLADALTEVVRRDIAVDEKLTFDYALATVVP